MRWKPRLRKEPMKNKKADDLVISEDLRLPIEVVTQKLSFLGRTGSGKSYAATKLCELMLSAEAQVVALDPVGVWWGLRTGGGFTIPVFGGLHGDIPLEPDAGELIADLIVERGISAVLDVSQMLPSEQAHFAYAFATQFFQRKKAKPSAVHLFVEECQEFVPQNLSGRGQGGFEAMMLGAFERLIKLGRNFGIGASLISQRPQEVNKKALNQTECLFAFQMTGPQERKAIESWVSEKGGELDIMQVLPKLEIGQPHVWSPQWLRVSKTVKIARKVTADVSSTPKPGAAPAAVTKLSPVDLDELRKSIAATIEEAKANDPAELRREITRLTRELGKVVAPPAATVQVLSEEEAQLLRDARLWMGNGFATRLEGIQKGFVQCIDAALVQVRGIASVVARVDAQTQKTVHIHSRVERVRVTPGPDRKARKSSMAVGEQSVLVAVSQNGSKGVTPEQLTILTSYKRSTRNAYLQRLTVAGMVERVGERIVATKAGIEALGDDFAPLPTGEDLQRFWIGRLPAGESAILQLVIDQYPEGIDREIIGQRTGFKRSTRNAYIQRLQTRELVRSNGSFITASEHLFT